MKLTEIKSTSTIAADSCNMGGSLHYFSNDWCYWMSTSAGGPNDNFRFEATRNMASTNLQYRTIEMEKNNTVSCSPSGNKYCP